ncbi:MAG: zf-HC2 domain-containing protein, partial [Acidobacteria bacterium]|nr:zf-HC2 domain-containing protein [Acidobacteriota bacterium]
MSSNRSTTCSAAMELFHRVLDGDLMEATDRQGMQAHLAVCSECAEKAGQLREMQDLLRGMAE